MICFLAASLKFTLLKNEIMLTSDGSDDFSITAIDGSRSLEEPPEISEVANAGNASAGFELVGIDSEIALTITRKNGSGAQTYFVDGIFQYETNLQRKRHRMGTSWRKLPKVGHSCISVETMALTLFRA